MKSSERNPFKTATSFRLQYLFRFRSFRGPIIAALALVVVGASTRFAMEESIKSKLVEELTTILEADVEALRIWLDTQETIVARWAKNPEVVSLAERLMADNPGYQPDVGALRDHPALHTLRQLLGILCEEGGYVGFAIFRPDGLILASLDGEHVGVRVPLESNPQLVQMLRGETRILRPFFLSRPTNPEEREIPAMAVGAPIPLPDAKPAPGGTTLAFRIPPHTDFTRILSVARLGESGETYAFDKRGVMISNSRFETQLRKIGLIEDRPDSRSILKVEIRDPGDDMTRGFRPARARNELPLTRMAASAVRGETGVDVDGYRDYRGVPVVGAWTWLEEYGFGVSSEIDVAEAYAPLFWLRVGFWCLFSLLGLGTVGLLLSSNAIGALRGRVREISQLGQYTLKKKIGAGAMGEVYLAQHALLRRPTAIKLLRPENADLSKISRFEREVQLTSQLTHPNTIAIYDYGRTRDDVFYYAMEYLVGVDLRTLVAREGSQPEARVVHLLRQACGSLAEAHAAGLIHRDIKPANLMICERGGVYDTLKVLDFGLVKDVEAPNDPGVTAANTITGTPLFMSPEAIRSPGDLDGRSDLYSLAAVGYFLVTGKNVFEGETVLEVCHQHVLKEPVPPSKRTDQPVSEDLEALLLKCLEKNRGDRPRDATEMAEELAACRSAGAWPQKEARARWKIEHVEPEKESAAEASPMTRSITVSFPESRE